MVKSVSFGRLRALNQSLVVNSVSRERFNLSFHIVVASAVRVVGDRASKRAVIHHCPNQIQDELDR